MNLTDRNKRELISNLGKILKLEPINGGDTHQAFKLTTTSGDYFLKQSQVYLPEVFFAEARELELLSRLNILKVPKVILVGDNFIVLELLDLLTNSRSLAQSSYELGVGLARLHQTSSDQWGFETNNYIGIWPQKNEPTSDWRNFYCHQRLMPQLEIARKNHKSSHELDLLFGKFFEQIEQILPNDFEKSLLHGDFWSGNWAPVTDVKTNRLVPAVFDPALYFGHREVDLAMAELFGGFKSEFFQGYHDTWPLEVGFEIRKHIYQLYPLLVHLNSFGKTYQSQLIHKLKTILA